MAALSFNSLPFYMNAILHLLPWMQPLRTWISLALQYPTFHPTGLPSLPVTCPAPTLTSLPVRCKVETHRIGGWQLAQSGRPRTPMAASARVSIAGAVHMEKISMCVCIGLCMYIFFLISYLLFYLEKYVCNIDLYIYVCMFIYLYLFIN